MSQGSKPKRKKVPSVFGVQLAQLMKDRRLTHRTVAEMAGVSVSVVSSWTGEGGAIPHDLTRVAQLAQRLGVSFHWLVLGEPPPATVSLHDLFAETRDDSLSGIWRIEARRLVQRTRC